jgi:hypothetical protein
MTMSFSVSIDDRSSIGYDENVKQPQQLDSETQQMHSINKLDIFFTYIVDTIWIISLNIITYKFSVKYSKYIDHSEIGPPVVKLQISSIYHRGISEGIPRSYSTYYTYRE